MKKLINADELAEMFGIKKSTVYAWTHRKTIPYVKIGGKIRFKIADIEQFITDNSVETVSR